MNIALVAHDGRKQELLDWIKYNYQKLSKHNLYATGTTGKKIEEIYIGVPISGYWDEHEWCYDFKDVEFPFKNKINKLLSGPLGGDAQIGAMIAEGKIDCLIFFCDNLVIQGHQNDIQGLSRLASLYNVAFATNRTTADMIMTSPLFGSNSYHRIIPSAIESYRTRVL